MQWGAVRHVPSQALQKAGHHTGWQHITFKNGEPTQHLQRQNDICGTKEIRLQNNGWTHCVICQPCLLQGRADDYDKDDRLTYSCTAWFDGMMQVQADGLQDPEQQAPCTKCATTCKMHHSNEDGMRTWQRGPPAALGLCLSILLCTGGTRLDSRQAPRAPTQSMRTRPHTRSRPQGCASDPRRVMHAPALMTASEPGSAGQVVPHAPLTKSWSTGDRHACQPIVKKGTCRIRLVHA